MKEYFCTCEGVAKGIYLVANNRIEARKNAAKRFGLDFMYIWVSEVRND